MTNHFRYSKFVVLIVCFVLSSCLKTPSETFSYGGVSGDELNTFFDLSPIKELNSTTSDGIWINAQNSSEYEILFDTEDWLVILPIDGNMTGELPDRVERQFDRVTMFPEGEAHDLVSIFLAPDFSGLSEAPQAVRIIVFGTIYNTSESINGKRVAAYIDVELSTR